jgi:hypothetical protein
LLDYSRWNREALANFSFHCVSTNDLSSAKSIAVRLFDLVAPFIKRPHLSAVSFLKSELFNCNPRAPIVVERFAEVAPAIDLRGNG